MLKRVMILVLLASLPMLSAVAQVLSESYYRENPDWLDPELWVQEGEYRSMPQILNSPFEQYARWGFSFVSYGFRGESENSLTTRLGGVDVASPLDSYPNYTLLNLLRRIPARRTDLWSNAHSEWGADVRSEVFAPSPSALSERHRLRVQLSSRSYRLGSYYSSVGRLDSLWSYSLLVGGRWGRDGNIEGVFTEEEQLWLSAERCWGEGVRRSLQMALMVAPMMRSGRSWNSDEVFELAGDNHYNSYWGYQQGKVRSSRVRRECVPTFYASFNIDDSYILSNLNISTLLSAGRKSRTKLSWADAPNPLPDYYLYLPSAQSDPEVALLAEEAWLRGEERFTQIDWQGLYTANALSVGGVRYALLEEMADVVSAKVDASAAFVGIHDMRLGVRLSLHTTNNHNAPRDLLGGNTLGEGIGLYDYSLGHSAWELYFTHQKSTDWGTLSLAAEMGGVRLAYDSATSGRRATREFLTADVVARWSRSVGDGASVGSNLRYAYEPPHWSAVFGSADGAMTRNPYAESTHSVAAELWGVRTMGRLTLHSTLFARYRNASSKVEHFWNDFAGCYAALLAGGFDSFCYGVELSALVAVGKKISATLHTTLLSSRYVSDAVGDVVSFDNGKPLAKALPLRVEGLTTSSSPLAAAGLEVRYRAPYDVVLGAEWSIVGLRYMEPALFLCSDEVLSRDLSPEVRNDITTSQPLGAAHSLNLFAYRNVGRFTLSLSVGNLLNHTDGYYDGYQPSRMRVRESNQTNTYTPHSPRYQHIYPRYVLMSLGYEF